MTLNPVRWWKLRKRRQELARLMVMYRECAAGETTVFAADQMWRLFQRVHALKAEIIMLEGGP